MISAEQKQLVFTEYETFLARCEQHGISSLAVQWTLTERSMAEAAQARVEAQAQRPGYAELEAAYQQRHLERSDAAWRVLSLAWLKAATKAELGDVVLVYGWREPREIMLTEFSLCFNPSDKSPLAAYLGLEGPTYQKGPGFKASQRSFTPVSDAMYRTEASDVFRRRCADSGITLLRNKR